MEREREREREIPMSWMWWCATGGRIGSEKPREGDDESDGDKSGCDGVRPERAAVERRSVREGGERERKVRQ
jgi:hypothetical protein